MTGVDTALLVRLLLAELIFGIAYNLVTEWLEKQGWNKGFTSLLVVFGVAVTVLLMQPLLGWSVIELLILAFSASGFPMVTGSISRYLYDRAKEDAALINALANSSNREEEISYGVSTADRENQVE